VPIEWQEIDGSKLGVVEATVTMARDLARIRLAYMLRLWTIDRAPSAASSECVEG
jgi:hypothetical protein